MLFFFSSRRRHTRLQGDWSSDVCSSDLVRVEAAVGRACVYGGAFRYTTPSACRLREAAQAPFAQQADSLIYHSFGVRIRSAKSRPPYRVLQVARECAFRTAT